MERNPYLFHDRLERGRFVGRYGLSVLLQRFEVAPERIFRHLSCFFERLSLGSQVRDGRERDHITAFLGRLEERRKQVFFLLHILNGSRTRDLVKSWNECFLGSSWRSWSYSLAIAQKVAATNPQLCPERVAPVSARTLYSGAEDGAYVCAHNFTTTEPNRVSIAVADCGQGIREHLGGVHPEAAGSDRDAVTLALRPGITGARPGMYGTPDNAGAGLFITRSIAKGSGGYFLLVGKAGYRLMRANHPEDKDRARELRLSAVLPQLEKGGKVVFDFERAKYVTQSFVHALVGEPLKRYGAQVLDRIEFKNCSAQVRSVVALVVDYSLGGFSNGEPEEEPKAASAGRKRRAG